MKAWRIEKHGDLDVLEQKEISPPEPGPCEVRVQVRAVGLNHLDIWVRKGVPGHAFPLPITPGCDIAGEVEKLGPGAEEKLHKLGIQSGSRVLVNPGVSCGVCAACLEGFDPLCPSYGILGEDQDGGCADFVVVPVTNLIALPEQISFEEAAALPIPFLTAWTMLVRKTGIRPGEYVLIQAGGSGVSVAAIQIAKLFGAKVITTVGSDEKIPLAKSLGADHVLNYRNSPFREQLKRILKPIGKRGVDVVVDHVGSDTFSESFKSLAWGGRLVTCGATSGSDVRLDLKPLFFKNISIHGSTMGSKADLIRLVGLVGERKLHPVIDSVFKMDQYKDACAKIESRKAFGKVLVAQC